ncbi:hypothetical protein HJFPF1_05844 [Paramyrothecium foliicola]|nr:hypothetical protein HJFPF1_05844 [Paramyrothecium foliicola]
MSTTMDMTKSSSQLGTVFAAAGLAALISSLISGLVIMESDGSYTIAQCFAGSDLLINTLLMVAARVITWRKNGGFLCSKT